MHEDEVILHPEHYDDARHHHHKDLHEIARREQKERNDGIRNSSEDEEVDIGNGEDLGPVHGPTMERSQKPEYPDDEYLYNMLIKVHFRDRYL